MGIGIGIEEGNPLLAFFTPSIIEKSTEVAVDVNNVN